MRYRKPTFEDIEAIFSLVNSYAEKGVMLARSRNALYETIRDMLVAEENGKIIGVGGLHFMWDKMAEVRTMAVHPDYLKKGIGREIVNRLVEDGINYGVQQIFTLTYQPEFFSKLGFSELNKDKLPHKVWKECINCPKFPNCDEIAMIKIM